MRPRLIIGTTKEGVAGITTEGFKLPPGTVVIERDYEKGREPDEHGDLYTDVVLEVISTQERETA